MGRTIGYIRVSKDQNGHGPAAQLDAIRRHCRANGLRLREHDVFEDIGASGRSTRKRPAYAQALAELQPGDTLVAARLDRLNRSVVDFANLLVLARNRGFNVVVVDIGMDLATPHGELVANIMASVATWEARIISERTKVALAAAAEKGIRIGRGRAVSDETRKRLAAWHAQGRSLRRIARALNVAGIPGGHGGRWTAETVARVAGLRTDRAK